MIFVPSKSSSYILAIIIQLIFHRIIATTVIFANMCSTIEVISENWISIFPRYIHRSSHLTLIILNIYLVSIQYTPFDFISQNFNVPSMHTLCVTLFVFSNLLVKWLVTQIAKKKWELKKYKFSYHCSSIFREEYKLHIMKMYRLADV